jgi:hypothetical protein
VTPFFARIGSIVSVGFVALGVLGVLTTAAAAVNVLLTLLWLKVVRATM